MLNQVDGATCNGVELRVQNSLQQGGATYVQSAWAQCCEAALVSLIHRVWETLVVQPRNTFPEVFPEFCPSFQVSSPARAAFQESPGGQVLCQVHCKKAPHRCIPTSIDSLHWQRWKRQRLIHWWWQGTSWLKTESPINQNLNWNENKRSKQNQPNYIRTNHSFLLNTRIVSILMSGIT